MKRKLPLFLAMLMMVSIVCTSVAYAAPGVFSPSYEDYFGDPEDPEIEIDDPDVPLAEIPEVVIPVSATRSGDTSNAAVPEIDLENAIDEVTEMSAVRVTIISEGEEDATTAEVTMHGKLIRDLANTGVELNVVTPVGRVLLSNAAFQSFLHDGEDCDPTLVIERKPVELGHELLADEDIASERIDGGSVCLVYVTCAHGTYYTWAAGDITLYLPTGTAEFVEGNGYTVRHLDMDSKDIDTYVGQCVTDEYVANAAYYEYGGYAGDDGLRIAVTVGNGRLCYFVVLADAVEKNMGKADPAIVVAPVASKAAASSGSQGILASVQQWFDSVANQVMKLFGL